MPNAAKDVMLRTVPGEKGTWLLAVNTGKHEQTADISADPHFDRARENRVALGLSDRRLRLVLAPLGVRMTKLE